MTAAQWQDVLCRVRSLSAADKDRLLTYLHALHNAAQQPQLARHFNSGGKDTEQLRAQILEELSALTNFRLKAEETVGELYGNHQAFKLEEL